jgi:hypothetical protein
MEITFPFARLQLHRNPNTAFVAASLCLVLSLDAFRALRTIQVRGAASEHRSSKMDANNPYEDELDFSVLAIEDKDFAKLYAKSFILS